MEPTQTSLPAPEQPAPDWAGRIFGAFLLLWIAVVTIAVHVAGYFAGQVALATGDAWPGWVWLLIVLGQSALVFLPAGLLGRFWQRPRYRALFQVWAVAGLFPLVLAPVHLPPPLQAPLATVLQIVLASIFSGVVSLIGRRRRLSAVAGPTAAGSPALLALVVAPLLALPWLWWGAFGSWLDILLNLAAGASLGLAAALTLDIFWIRPFYATAADNGHGSTGSRILDLFLGGFVAGTALLLLGSGFGYNGTQLPLLLVLASLGWVVMALSRPQANVRALLLLLGLAAAAPLLLLDPRELAALLLLVPGLEWVFAATALAIAIGWLAGAVLLLGRLLATQVSLQSRRRAVLVLAVPAWLVAVAVYAGQGHPGLYGERLFVVLEDQASLATIPQGTDVANRRQIVYDTLVAHAGTTQADLRQALDRTGVEYRPYYLVNGLAVDGGPLLRLWLETRPEVDRVLANPTLRPIDIENVADPFRQTVPAPTEPPWNLTRIGAGRVWEELGITGAGVVVGQSDSGVQWDHPELLDGYRGSGGDHDYNWLDPWYGTEAPRDIGGHGTHTLGSVLGNGVGVAPDAEWYGCANLARNLGNTALYLDCLQFMLAPFPLNGDPLRDGDPARGANVLNNSWGCPDIEGCDPESLLPAIQALRAAGTFVVVSAGNDGPACASLDNPPAIYDEAFSVGATTPGDGLATFSSRGPVAVDGSNRVKPDIVAPGVQILSAFPGDSYRTWEGTSMAGPHLAGVVALMWSANPALVGDVETTEQILQDTAEPIAAAPACDGAGTVPTNTYGFGLVDAFAAVEAALAAGR